MVKSRLNLPIFIGAFLTGRHPWYAARALLVLQSTAEGDKETQEAGRNKASNDRFVQIHSNGQQETHFQITAKEPKVMMNLLLKLSVSAFLCVLVATVAYAGQDGKEIPIQQAPVSASPDEWHFTFTPYFWLPSADLDISVPEVTIGSACARTA